MAQVLAHPLVVDPDHVAKPGPFAILLWLLVSLALLNVSQRQLNQSGSHRPNLRKILYVIAARSRWLKGLWMYS